MAFVLLLELVNLRPAGPSLTAALFWGREGCSGPPSISVTNRPGRKFHMAMERHGQDLSYEV